MQIGINTQIPGSPIGRVVAQSRPDLSDLKPALPTGCAVVTTDLAKHPLNKESGQNNDGFENGGGPAAGKGNSNKGRHSFFLKTAKLMKLDSEVAEANLKKYRKVKDQIGEKVHQQIHQLWRAMRNKRKPSADPQRPTRPTASVPKPTQLPESRPTQPHSSVPGTSVAAQAALIKSGHSDLSAVTPVQNNPSGKDKVEGLNQPSLSKVVDATPITQMPENSEVWDIYIQQYATCEKVKDRIGKTHKPQTVSGAKNYCWLRSSWLSVFKSLSPEALEQRLRGICATEGVKNVDVPGLQKIAGLFWQDEKKFMGTKTNLDSLAHLGNDNIERKLKKIQLSIAPAFRTDLPNMLGEIKTLAGRFNTEMATSDVILALHRAFGLPLMVMERRGESMLFRVVAPETSELNRIVGQAAKNCRGFDNGNNAHALKAILKEFENHPVILLEGAHYTVYFPKKQRSQVSSATPG